MLQRSNLEIFRFLNKKRVRYILVGVYAIDHYVGEPGRGFHTFDCDILVEATPGNLLSVLKVLEKLGYQLEANKEPLAGIDLWFTKRIIEHQAVINARKENEMPLDVIINAGKIPYKEWSKGKKVFTVGGVKIPVGSLPMLIRAKENSNREKDRTFLKLYKIQLKEMLE